MTTPLTAADLERIASIIQISQGEGFGLDGWQDIDMGDTVDRLIAMARASLAPDPLALPLSVAMREARQRTEAGQETWVWVHSPDETCAEYDERFLLCYQGKIGWRYAVEVDADEPLWRVTGPIYLEMAERAVCRLVTPQDGMALLRGEE